MALTLVQNVALNDAASGQATATVCEPTAAANERQAFMTGNWFASSSADGGASWAFVNPFTRFPASAGGFCCDQVVLYNARHHIWIWLLQYSSGSNGENLFRLAISREAQFGNWYYWDFTPRGVNSTWTGNWFDYPDMAYTDANLFVTFNMFKGNAWQRAVVFRFPLATLASGGTLGYRSWPTTGNGSIRLCRGPGATMFRRHTQRAARAWRGCAWNLADDALQRASSVTVARNAWAESKMLTRRFPASSATMSPFGARQMWTDDWPNSPGPLPSRPTDRM